MREILFDIDNCVRDFDLAVFGHEPDSWVKTFQGKSIPEYLNAHPKVLRKAPKTKFCDAISEWGLFVGGITFISAQCGEKQRRCALDWLHDNLKCPLNVVFVDHPDQKIILVGTGVLVDDYPYFKESSYKNILVIDKPYNRSDVIRKNELGRITNPSKLCWQLKRVREGLPT